MHFNWKAFDAGAGFRVILTIALAVLFANWFGLAGPIIALAALVISMADNHGPLQRRVLNLVVFTCLVAVITAIAWVVSEKMWPVIITVTLLTFLSGFALYYGMQRAMEASFLLIWLIVMLPAIGSETLGGSVAAVLAAGLFVIALILIFTAIRRYRGNPLRPANIPPFKTGKPHLSWKSPTTLYTVSKTVAAFLCTWTGWLLIGGHPFWATWAPLMIIKPDLDTTVEKGINRLLGTFTGGLVGFLLITPIDKPDILAVLYLVSIFLQFATTKIHYSLMIFFLTLELVVGGALGGGVPIALSLDRAVATIVGVIISLITVAILSYLLKTDTSVDSPPPAREIS